MTYDKEELMKVLQGKDMLNYLFTGKLPLDIAKRVDAYRAKAGKPKQKRKNPAMKNAIEALADRKAGIAAGTPKQGEWKQSELILHVTEYTCTCCGKQYEAPDSPVLLVMSHPRQGKRTEVADGRGSDLPRRIIRSRRDTHGCPLCFDLETMLQQILDHTIDREKRQLDLPL